MGIAIRVYEHAEFLVLPSRRSHARPRTERKCVNAHGRYLGRARCIRTYSVSVSARIPDGKEGFAPGALCCLVCRAEIEKTVDAERNFPQCEPPDEVGKENLSSLFH